MVHGLALCILTRRPPTIKKTPKRSPPIRTEGRTKLLYRIEPCEHSPAPSVNSISRLNCPCKFVFPTNVRFWKNFYKNVHDKKKLKYAAQKRLLNSRIRITRLWKNQTCFKTLYNWLESYHWSDNTFFVLFDQYLVLISTRVIVPFSQIVEVRVRNDNWTLVEIVSGTLN